MRLTKLITKHDFYEIWCEHAAESVFIDHKPSREEMAEIRDLNWPGTNQWDCKHSVQLFKLKPFYTKSPIAVEREYRMRRGED